MKDDIEWQQLSATTAFKREGQLSGVPSADGGTFPRRLAGFGEELLSTGRANTLAHRNAFDMAAA